MPNIYDVFVKAYYMYHLMSPAAIHVSFFVAIKPGLLRNKVVALLFEINQH
jgi:hypothetical protein